MVSHGGVRDADAIILDMKVVSICWLLLSDGLPRPASSFCTDSTTASIRRHRDNRAASRQRLLVEQRLQRVVTQVRGDMDTFDAALMTQYRQRFRIHLVVHRQRRHTRSAHSVNACTTLSGSMVIFCPGIYTWTALPASLSPSESRGIPAWVRQYAHRCASCR